MQLIDEQIKRYEALDVPQTKRPDFDAFWTETVAACREKPLDIQGGRIDYCIPGAEVRDITFNGLDDTPVHAWLILPPDAKKHPVPVVCLYHGAGGCRQGPAQYMDWIMLGCAVLAMDFRLQAGQTQSNTAFSGGPQLYLSVLGIRDKRTAYMYHAFTDGLRSVETALQTPEIDPERIAVMGGSQGGGMSLGLAALHPAVSLCAPHVPSNCWMEKRLFDRAGGFGAVASYLMAHPDDLDLVCTTLSYFDHINLAERITCPVLMGVGLKDPVCPAENAYAAYNKITSEKRMIVYPFNEHEGGSWRFREEQLRFVRSHFSA